MIQIQIVAIIHMKIEKTRLKILIPFFDLSIVSPLEYMDNYIIKYS